MVNSFEMLFGKNGFFFVCACIVVGVGSTLCWKQLCEHMNAWIYVPYLFHMHSQWWMSENGYEFCFLFNWLINAMCDFLLSENSDVNTTIENLKKKLYDRI